MNEIKVSFHRSSYKTKPSADQIERIKSDLLENSITPFKLDRISSFARMVGEEGQAFISATFRFDFSAATAKAENFEQQQLFTLDFGNVVTFEEIKEKAELYDLPILFAYEPFSDNIKFRVVFLNDASITDWSVVAVMQRALMTVFTEADTISKKIFRVSLGGRKLLYFDPSPPTIDIEALFRGMSFALKDRYGKNYRRKIIEFSKDTGIRLNRNDLLDISIEDISIENDDLRIAPQAILNNIDHNQINENISPSSIIILSNIDLGEKFSKRYKINLKDSNPSINKERSSIHRPYRSTDLRNIESTCRLYQEFQSGLKPLPFDQLFGLATNLVQIEAGAARFKGILKSKSYFDDRPKKYSIWDYTLFYIRDYAPSYCEGFCPYKGTCSHGINILSTTKPRMERTADYEALHQYHPREDVERDVEGAIFKAHRTHGTMMQIIKAQTSIGKTTTYLKLMVENPSERFLIAAPTNILKDEVCEKAVKLGISVMKTPSLEAIKDKIPPKIRRHIALLYKTGRHRMVHPYIRETIKKEDIPCLRRYMEDREKIKDFDGSVITTHRYLLNMNEERLREFDTRIIDEDIIFKSIVSNQGQITLADLNELLLSASDARLIKKAAELIKHFEADTGSAIEVPGFEWDSEDNESEGMSTPFDIPSFCLATHFYCRRASRENNLKEDTVTFLKPITFYENIEYIMVSATVDENVCRKYFGSENVSFYECRKARYEGTLYQYHMKSMSRSSIGDDPEIIRRLMEKFGIDKVISFMKYGIGEFHFGNTEGCNQYEGQNLLVVGTPHHADFIYKLFAFSLGLSFDENTEMEKGLTVTHNGYRFPFTTYDDQELRAIHFWMLESELEQAVGRARLLRHPCSVCLFSNFPLWQAVMKDDKYWKC